MKIHCLIENTLAHPGLVAEHGLSLLIETGGLRILFDMGASPSFAENAALMGLDLAAVDMAVLSHGHYDHGGGLLRFLELNNHAPVWVSPHAFEPHFNAAGKDIGLSPALAGHPRLRSAIEGITHLAPGITLHRATTLPATYPPAGEGMSTIATGTRMPDDFRHEQYLLIEDAGRRILISGCTHRGILNIATHFKADFLTGGFHLMKSTAAECRQVAHILSSLPTTFYTGHCTGSVAFGILKSRLGNRLHHFSTGQAMEI